MRKRNQFVLIALIFVVASGGYLQAGTTDNWKLNSEENFREEGTFNGVELTSDGYLKPGTVADRITSGEIGIWSLTTGPEGTIYAGTGNRGIVVRVKNGETETVFQSEDQLLITDLIVNREGMIYAGTVPGRKENATSGRIYRIDPDGKSEIYATLKDSYIWDMERDNDGNIYAATSPKGKIFRITGSQEVEEYYDTGEDHVLSLAFSGDRNLYAGTATGGLLVRVTSKGEGSVVYEFDEQELRGLAFHKDTLYVGANEVRQFRPRRFVKRLRRSIEKYREGKTTEPAFEKMMAGAVYHVDPDGGVYPLWKFKKQYLTQLGVSRDGQVLLTTGDQGRVFRLNPSNRTYSYLFDFDDNQAQAMAFGEDGQLILVGTANPGSIYDLRGEKEEKSVYTSRVLDADYPAKFGKIRWAAAGEGNIEVRTRSGNTESPGQDWSDWSDPITSMGEEIKSPSARYLQIQVRWPTGSERVLKWINIPYLTRNQQPYFEKVEVDRENSEAGYSGKQKTKASVKLSWKANDPDGDRLAYRLFGRQRGKSNWFEITEKPLTDTSHKWNTKYVQNGWYEIKVVATDELDNPRDRSRSTEIQTANVLVDNNSPDVDALAVDTKRQVKGKASDPLSVVARIEYRINDRNWRVVFPDDELFDEKEESFEFQLPSLNPGTYQLTVRVYDAAGNTRVRQEAFSVKSD